MFEPFFSEELADSLETVNQELETCCGGVGALVEDFVNCFKATDIAFLVYVMETMTIGMKESLSEYDSYIYDLLQMSAQAVVIKGPDKEGADDES